MRVAPAGACDTRRTSLADAVIRQLRTMQKFILAQILQLLFDIPEKWSKP